MLKITAQSLFFLGNLLVFGGLSVSRPVLSIGTGLVAVAGIWQWIQQKEHNKVLKDKYVWAFTVFFAVCLLAYFHKENKVLWAEDIRIKLLFLILPFAYNLLEMSKKQFFVVSYFFILAQFIIAALSFGKYFVEYDDAWAVIMQHIQRNGTIDLISHIHHIYFGLFLAFSIFLAAFWFGEKTIFFHRHEKWLMFIFILLNTIVLHLLTSRTGFLVFYLAILAWGMISVFQKGKKIIGLGLIIGFITIPLFAYYYLPSFQARINMTTWDVEQYTKEHILCDCSMGKRFYVWEQTVKIIRQNPILGTGNGDLAAEILAKSKAQLPEMQLAIDMDETRLLESPHNQYLEMLAGMGIVGLIILLYILIYPFIFERKQLHWLQIVLILQIVVAMCTESLLKRQWGVAFFVVFLLISRRFLQIKTAD